MILVMRAMKVISYACLAMLSSLSSAYAATLWEMNIGKTTSSSSISDIGFTQTPGGAAGNVSGSVSSLIGLDTMTGAPSSPGTNLGLSTQNIIGNFLAPNVSLITGPNLASSYPEQGWCATMDFSGSGYFSVDSVTLSLRDYNLTNGSWHSGATAFKVSVSILDQAGTILGTTTNTINFGQNHNGPGLFTFSFADMLINMNEGIQLQVSVYDGGVGQYGNLNGLTQGVLMNKVTFKGELAPEPSAASIGIAGLGLLMLRRRR